MRIIITKKDKNARQMLVLASHIQKITNNENWETINGNLTQAKA